MEVIKKGKEVSAVDLVKLTGLSKTATYHSISRILKRDKGKRIKIRYVKKSAKIYKNNLANRKKNQFITERRFLYV